MLLRDSRHAGLTVMTCRERELTLDHIHNVLTTQGHGGLPRRRDQLTSGTPPRQHKDEWRYTFFTHLFILTRRIWNNDYDGQMIFGGLVGLKLPDICLTSEKNPEKTSPRKLVPTRDRTRTRCETGARATACSTAVDNQISQLNLIYCALFSFFICNLPPHSNIGLTNPKT